MANATRKERHSYKLSYAQEVGSSIDPDMEDVASWEQELAGMYFYVFFHPKGSYIKCYKSPKLILLFLVMQFRTRPSPMVLLLGHRRGKNLLPLILMTKNLRLMQKNVLLWLISMIYRKKNYLVGVISKSLTSTNMIWMWHNFISFSRRSSVTFTNAYVLFYFLFLNDFLTPISF